MSWEIGCHNKGSIWGFSVFLISKNKNILFGGTVWCSIILIKYFQLAAGEVYFFFTRNTNISEASEKKTWHSKTVCGLFWMRAKEILKEANTGGQKKEVVSYHEGEPELSVPENLWRKILPYG